MHLLGVYISLCEKAGAYGSQKSTSGCLPWSQLLVFWEQVYYWTWCSPFWLYGQSSNPLGSTCHGLPVLARFTIPNILHGCWWLNIGIHAFTASTLPSRAFSAALGLVPISNKRWLTTACNSRFQVVFQPVRTYARLHIHTDTHIDVIKIITRISKKFKHTLN